MILYEHTVARSLTKAMGDALDGHEGAGSAAIADFAAAARSYIELLTNHIYKEDNVLFAMGEQVLVSEDTKGLCDQFCALSCRRFEGRTGVELEAIVADLEAKHLNGPSNS
jgi:hemerythrin-like domain-containing protein